MENLIEKIKTVRTLETSIGEANLNKLACMMSQDSENEEHLENTLLYFYSLGAADVDTLLSIFRKRMASEFDAADPMKAFYEKNSEKLNTMFKDFNKASVKEYGQPFHLAAALGKVKAMDDIAAKNAFSIDGLFNSSAKGLGGCPMDSYPYYVGSVFPWKLRASFHISTKQRKEDTGCHFEHGPFNGTIKGWVTYSPLIVGMIGLQGWGFKLAANNNYLFYKWWFVVAMGLTPYNCMLSLFVRVY